MIRLFLLAIIAVLRKKKISYSLYKWISHIKFIILRYSATQGYTDIVYIKTKSVH